MKFHELLRFSAQNLWRRKLRTSLTLLGVMIGTASIVVMMSLGIGLNYSYMKQIEASGTLTLITVYSYGGGGGMYYAGGKMDGGGAAAEAVALDSDAVDAFGNMAHVRCASPVYNFSILAQSGKYQADLYVYAMSYDMLAALKLPVLEGALPARGDDLALIAGKQVAFNFYDPKSTSWGWGDPTAEPPVDMMNASLFAIYDVNAYYMAQGGGMDGEAPPMPKKYLLETVATLGLDNSEYGWSQYDYNVYADLEAVEREFTKVFKKAAWPSQQLDSKGKPINPMTYSQAYVLVDDIDNVAAVQEQITAMGFQASSDMDYLKSMQEQSRVIQYVLAGIGSVSMLVAAIGIANTMLMSIFERTKEIGVFKVLGCSLGNIRTMFLTEAALIGFSGGVLGITLSFLLSKILNIFLGDISIVPFWLVLLGLGFAVGVGMIAGLSPAIRATKLSPLEAIRSL